jgi:DNA-binding transcriptional ArsR family regulator
MNTKEKLEISRLHAGFCKTISDATRLSIISEISVGELSVSDIAKKLGLNQSNVSKHLALMREHGLVNTRRDGSTVYYILSDYRIYQAVKLLCEVQSDQLKKMHSLSSANGNNK